MPPEFMLIDTQLSRYFWAAEKMGYKPLRGILFNELKTAAPTIPKWLEASQRLEQRKNLRCDVYTYYREILRHGQKPEMYSAFLRHLMNQRDDWFRRTRLPKDRALTQRTLAEMMMTAREMKEAERLNEFPRAPDKSCTWGCSFLDPCSIQLMGGKIDDVIRIKYTTRTDREEEGNG
jgi:hypothetical protein